MFQFVRNFVVLFEPSIFFIFRVIPVFFLLRWRQNGNIYFLLSSPPKSQTTIQVLLNTSWLCVQIEAVSWTEGLLRRSSRSQLPEWMQLKCHNHTEGTKEGKKKPTKNSRMDIVRIYMQHLRQQQPTYSWIALLLSISLTSFHWWITWQPLGKIAKL